MATRRTKRAIHADLAAEGFEFSSLLSRPQSNPKVWKSAKKAGVLTFVMHLAPHSVSGFNTCASATPACINPCLDQSGNPAAGAGKRAARIARTRAFFMARPLFLELLRCEIDAAIARAARLNMDCAFRLNGTSDIRFEAVRFLDPRGHVAGLRYKFKTTRDAEPRAEQIRNGVQSGFIVAQDDPRVIW